MLYVIVSAVTDTHLSRNFILPRIHGTRILWHRVITPTRAAPHPRCRSNSSNNKPSLESR
jgi:hypothetical protein